MLISFILLQLIFNFIIFIIIALLDLYEFLIDYSIRIFRKSENHDKKYFKLSSHPLFIKKLCDIYNNYFYKIVIIFH